jgi:hypothetical protein
MKTELRYAFTKPVIAGRKTWYFEKLEEMYEGVTYHWKYVREIMGKTMTFYSLRSHGLIDSKSGVFEITPKGKEYVELINSANQVPRVIVESFLMSK